MVKSGQSISDERHSTPVAVYGCRRTALLCPYTEAATSIEDTLGKIMQNHGGANADHAEARNYFYCGDGNDSCGGIFPHAASTVARAWMAGADRTPMLRVPDVPW